MSQLRAPSATHAGGMRGRNASKTRRTTTREDPYDGGEREEHQENEEWQYIKEALISIKEGLDKEEVNQRYTNELSRVIARVPHASRYSSTQDLAGRLDRIEALLTASGQKGETTQAHG